MKTWIRTPGWLSAYIENVGPFFVGKMVLHSMSFVMTTPAVSKPTDKGMTSNTSQSTLLPVLHRRHRFHRGPVHHIHRWLHDVLLISQVLQATQHIAVLVDWLLLRQIIGLVDAVHEVHIAADIACVIASALSLQLLRLLRLLHWLQWESGRRRARCCFLFSLFSLAPVSPFLPLRPFPCRALPARLSWLLATLFDSLAPSAGVVRC